jgi:glycosyltransferase involved in cell wall biosynthesis
MVARRQSKDGDAVECVCYRDWTKAQIGEADEVWVHSMWTPGVMRAAWTALRMGKRLVRMPHGCMDPVKVRHHWWKKMWVTPFEKWLFRRSDSVIATCEDEAKWIKDFEHLVKKVEMLSLGECVDFSRVERVDRVGDADGSLRLLFIGRLHPLKGVEFLLHAIKEYQSSMRSMRSLRLKIIGKDEGEGEKLKQLAKDYGLNVEFCGVVSEEEKEQAWDWCDVLVLPTLSENFGLVVAEALERGKRVITTDGAPAWGVGLSYVDCVEGGEILIGYGGRLVYLKGYREGMMEKRVALLKKAIEIFGDNY